jgi:predicted nuclease of predicted toxin-antitoxin system
MLFLADESCDFAIVRALREAGHDVVAVAEISPGAEDQHVIETAFKENRVLLTEDKDFGQLVFAHKKRSAGILLVRYPTNARKTLAAAVVDLVTTKAEIVQDQFVVLRPGRLRIVPKPGV